jgi:multidrug resistance protein, MATE family
MEANIVNRDGSWWTRPAGGREVVRVALPLVASMLSWTAMQFTDRVILHWVSGTAMTAGFQSSIMWFAGMSLLFGVCTYVSTFVSQYHGDGQPERIGPIAWQGVWLALLFTPIGLAGIPLAPAIFDAARHDPALARLEIEFFQILCWAAPGFLGAMALEAFYSGRGRTLVVMCVDVAAVLLNLVLACVWVLGWGVEPWGMAGAAWATVTAQWFRFVVYLVLVLSPANRRTYNTLSMRLDWRLVLRLLRFGGPAGVQMMLDICGFTVFIMLVGRLGLVESEATSMVFSVGHLAFMPVWAFGIATTVLVGQRLGEDRSDLARQTAWTSLGITICYMAFISALFVGFPDVFLGSFFAHNAEGGVDPALVREMATRLLWFVAAYNLLDATAIIFVSVLKGAGDTRFVMGLSGVMAVALAVATWLGVERLDMGVYGCWTLITVWIWALGLAYLVRFLEGSWRRMRVIDQKHGLPPSAPGEAGVEFAARAGID